MEEEEEKARSKTKKGRKKAAVVLGKGRRRFGGRPLEGLSGCWLEQEEGEREG